MKRMILILLALALAIPAFAADEAPTVALQIEQRIDPYGGGEYSFSYVITCLPEGECFIVDQEKLNTKLGVMMIVTWCNSWGQCSKTAYWPEED